MNESALSNDPGTQKRRSTRIVQAVPLTVTGVDAWAAFKERTTTVMVNCHGCKYQSKHYVPKNSIVTLDIPSRSRAARRTPFKGVLFGFSVLAPFANFFRLGSSLKPQVMCGALRSLPTIGRHQSRKAGTDASRTLELVQEFEIDAAASAPPEGGSFPRKPIQRLLPGSSCCTRRSRAKREACCGCTGGHATRRQQNACGYGAIS